MFKRFAVMTVLALSINSAYAISKPSEVRAVVSTGNYVLAEHMLIDVLKEKPSAKAHYDLGQVYSMEGKHSQALTEYRQAQVLDPTLKFASSSDEFIKKLGNEQKLVSSSQVLSATNYSSTREVAQPMSVQQPSESHIGGILLALLGFAALSAGAFFIMSRKEKKSIETAMSAERLQKNKTLLGLSKELEDALLIAKTATYDDTMKTQITGKIVTYQAVVRSMLAEIKDGKDITATRLASLETNVNIVVDQASNGISVPEPKIEAPAAPPPTTSAWRDATWPSASDNGFTPTHSLSAPTPSLSRTVHHYHHNTVPTPAPVIVQNNDGLLTGILIGEAMNRPHERTVERTVYVERDPVPRMDTPRYERDTYEEPAAPVQMDLPSNDSDSYQADTPSVDTSSSSDDSY